MMIALFVMSVGLFAIIGLSFGNVLQTRTSLNEVQASNFAREGIEIVRNIRDSNKYKKTGNPATGLNPVRWNEGVGWDSTIPPGSSQEGEWSIDTAGRVLISADATGGNRRIYQDASKLYVQPGSSGGANTKFERTVWLYPICSSGSATVDDFGKDTGSTCDFNTLDTGSGSTIGVQVIAIVKWQEEQRSRTITVEDRLYNW